MMKNKFSGKVVYLMIWGALFLFGCSSQSPEHVDVVSTQPTIEDEQDAITASTLDQTSAMEIIPLEELEEWDLVWISDSSGWGVAEIYGEMAAEDNSKIINVRDLWEGGFEAGLMLEILKGEYTGNDFQLEKLPEYIAEAELIVFYGNPEQSINSARPGDWQCIGAAGYYVNDCDPEIFATYIEHLKEIYRLILEIRGGQPTIIRTYDAYNPLINQFRESGVYEDCKSCWGYYNDAIRQAAAEMGIPLAPVAELWNGPDWTVDPDDDLGYTKDHIHPNQLGAEVIAQALRELGYEPVLP